MARIALIDPSGRAATTVRAVLGRAHEIAVRSRVHAPGDVDLVIADLRYTDLVDQSTLRGLISFAPVLVLIDRREPVPPALEEGHNLGILRKPFDSFELRLKVDHLLRAAVTPAASPAAPVREEEETTWLEFPYVPAPAGAVLRRAAKLAAPLWILGEPGCGRRRIALAVCRMARPPLRAVTLFPDERIEAVLAREKDAGSFALVVPEVEERALLEQERLAAILAGPRGFRLIATSVDDPADRVVAGTFSRNLYRHLVGLAVQISPLRERPIAIPPLAQALARRIARSLGSQGELSFSPDAMAKLQTYMWPGNLVELDAVLTRTLTSLSESDLDGRTIEDSELLFTPEDAVRPRTASRAERAFEKSTDRAFEKSAERGFEKSTERGFERSTDRAFERSADRGYDRFGDRPVERSGERVLERPGERSSEPHRAARIERGASPAGFRGPLEAARRAEPEPSRRPEIARAPEPDAGRIRSESARSTEGESTRMRADVQRPRPEIVRSRASDATSASEPAASSSDTFETIVASLAHDLRNPMTAIKTFASVIAAGRASPDSTGELGALASEACDRLEGYLQALQQYGTFGAPRMESVDVADLVRRTVADRDAAGRARVDLPSTLAVRCDPFQMRFVIDNLVAEALAEAGEKGLVTVAVEPSAGALAGTQPSGNAPAGTATLVLRVPAARGAVAKLHRLSAAERQPASWRVVLARALAARNGCKVDVEGAADGMVLRCRLAGGEGGGGGQQQQQSQQQTDRTDHR